MKNISEYTPKSVYSRRALRVPIYSLALVMAAPAFAATASADANVDTRASNGDIVVTATRRSENLRDVPVAITAVSGDVVKEARIQNFADIPALVPGANFVSPKGPSTASVAIRGQSQVNDSPHLDIPVAVFMDDIYFGTLASFAADFFDIDQIAILRGPQGTTFGRNVVGGALQINSNKAKIGVNAAEINVTASKFATADKPGVDSQGFVNFATSENSAFRLAYSGKAIGGYYHNRTTGTYLGNQRSIALRPSFTVEANDKLTIGLMGQYFYENGKPSGYRSIGQGSVQAACDALRENPWDVCHNVDGYNKRRIWLAQLRFDLDLGGADLTSISSFRHLKSDYRDDGDNSPLPMNTDSLNASRERQFSQEIRITSSTKSALEYVAGVYLSSERLQKRIDFAFNGTVPGSRLATMTGGQLQAQQVQGISNVASYAAFLEGKYNMTDQLAVTLGGRYTIERKTGSTDHFGSSVFYGAAFSVNDLEDTWRKFTPRAIVEFKPAKDVMLYASAASGFKGGGWSLTSRTASAARIPLAAETSMSYEIGAKVRLFDAWNINLAAYHADTKNLQVRSLDNGVLTDTNAGKLRVKGVEIESTLSLSDQLNLHASYAYTDAKFASFKGCAAGGVDCTGNQAPFTPENDLTVGARFNTELAGGTLTADISSQWASSVKLGPLGNQPFAENRTKKDGVINASIGYTFPDELTRVVLFGRNLTNKWFFSTSSNYGFYFLTQAEVSSGLSQVERGVLNPPRQIGLTLTRKF